jgi:hypothetical protein
MCDVANQYITCGHCKEHSLRSSMIETLTGESSKVQPPSKYCVSCAGKLIHSEQHSQVGIVSYIGARETRSKGDGLLRNPIQYPHLGAQ